jgi:hypothetical protein
VVLRTNEVGALVGAPLGARITAAQQIASIVLRADAGVAKITAGEGSAGVAAAIGIANQIVRTKERAFVGTILVAGVAAAEQIAIRSGVAARRAMILRAQNRTLIGTPDVARATAAQNIAIRIPAERLAIVLRTDHRAAPVGTGRSARAGTAADVARAAAAARIAQGVAGIANRIAKSRRTARFTDADPAAAVSPERVTEIAVAGDRTVIALDLVPIRAGF